MNLDLTKPWQTIQGIINGFLALLPNLILATVAFLLFILIAHGLRHVVRRLASERLRTHNAGMVLGRVTFGLTILIGALVAISLVAPSFKAADLVQALGIGGVAVGFAFKDIFQNFLAGILILWTEPFRIGDQIVVGDFEGTVEAIQGRATLIRTYDDRRVVMPNSELFTHAVTVNTAYSYRRFTYDVGIGVADNISEARQAVLQALRSVEEVLEDPAPQCFVVELADFSVKLQAWWWTTPPTRKSMLETQDKVLEAIKRELLERGIDLPYPTQTLLFHDQTDEYDGDRTRQREGWPAGKNPPKPRTVAGGLLRLGKVEGTDDRRAA